MPHWSILSNTPLITDRTKLNAMTFLNLLCTCSQISKPLLLPILSSRMLKLTLQHGLCADGIVGLALAGHSMVRVLPPCRSKCLCIHLSHSFLLSSLVPLHRRRFAGASDRTGLRGFDRREPAKAPAKVAVVQRTMDSESSEMHACFFSYPFRASSMSKSKRL